MSDETKRVLPADVYDALELSALAFGGIGGNSEWERGAPMCIYGHIDFIAGEAGFCTPVSAIQKAVRATAPDQFVSDANDTAVARINRRRGRPAHTRVSFAEYVAERGWERGA